MGAAGVARVAAWLLSSGWHVAWPMEDGGSGYDLLAHRQSERGQEYRRIQVKSALAPRLNRSGNRGPDTSFPRPQKIACTFLVIFQNIIGCIDKDNCSLQYPVYEF